jgi:calcineurin-like phosphoesterase family protein/predicted kinase
MKTVFFLKGLPASGKSTYARQMQAEDSKLVRVNKDDLRSMLHNGIHSKGREELVLRVRDYIISTSLGGGNSVIVDDTNFHPKHKQAVKYIANSYGAVFKEILIEASVDECIRRDSLREKPVGAGVIITMFREYLNNEIINDIPLDKIWVISDTHFNHKMLLDAGVRPADYNEQIVKNWNDLVGDDDYVIHLGDVIFGDKTLIKDINSKLKGHKILVRGNHDYKKPEWYIENGFEKCTDSLVYKNDGVEVLFTHIPREDDGTFKLNIHGHLHSQMRKEENATVLTDKHKLIALETMGYRPFKLKDLLGEDK